MALAWKPSSRLDLRSTYSFLDLDFRSGPGSTDTVTARIIEGSSARHQAGLQASYRLAQRWMLAGFLRYVGRLPRTATPTVTSGPTHVPSYAELGVRAAYRPWSSLELAVSGENLLARQHPEFGATASRTEVQRAVLLSSTWLW